jgi:hypothetical protein
MEADFSQGACGPIVLVQRASAKVSRALLTTFAGLFE